MTLSREKAHVARNAAKEIEDGTKHADPKDCNVKFNSGCVWERDVGLLRGGEEYCGGARYNMYSPIQKATSLGTHNEHEHNSLNRLTRAD